MGQRTHFGANGSMLYLGQKPPPIFAGGAAGPTSMADFARLGRRFDQSNLVGSLVGRSVGRPRGTSSWRGSGCGQIGDPGAVRQLAAARLPALSGYFRLSQWGRWNLLSEPIVNKAKLRIVEAVDKSNRLRSDLVVHSADDPIGGLCKNVVCHCLGFRREKKDTWRYGDGDMSIWSGEAVGHDNGPIGSE
jgi:hypothetical protein